MYTSNDRMMAQKNTARLNKMVSAICGEEPKTNNLNLEEWELRAIVGTLTDSMDKQGGSKGSFSTYGKIRTKIINHLNQ